MWSQVVDSKWKELIGKLKIKSAPVSIKILSTVAVQSKVDNLLKKIIDPSTSVDLNNCEVRTIMSAIKALFRNLREPILTFEHHETIIGNLKPQST